MHGGLATPHTRSANGTLDSRTWRLRTMLRFSGWLRSHRRTAIASAAAAGLLAMAFALPGSHLPGVVGQTLNVIIPPVTNTANANAGAPVSQPAPRSQPAQNTQPTNSAGTGTSANNTGNPAPPPPPPPANGSTAAPANNNAAPPAGGTVMIPLGNGASVTGPTGTVASYNAATNTITVTGPAGAAVTITGDPGTTVLVCNPAGVCESFVLPASGRLTVTVPAGTAAAVQAPALPAQPRAQAPTVRPALPNTGAGSAQPGGMRLILPLVVVAALLGGTGLLALRRRLG